ncbi:hypothetical protein QBC45DRAFT_396702 [Copromyces sp. CBS 386.78]|nr:hypothetical protein QBC45DRAFT_396702 [Copromyces sp. CBS 386.78]
MAPLSAAAAADAAKVDIFTKVVAGLVALVGTIWVGTKIWSKCRGDSQEWRMKEELQRMKMNKASTTTTTTTTTTPKMAPLSTASSTAVAAAADVARVELFTKVVAGVVALVGGVWVATQIWSKCRGDSQERRHKEEKWKLEKEKVVMENRKLQREMDKEENGGTAAAAVGGVGPGNLHRRPTNRAITSA